LNVRVNSVVAQRFPHLPVHVPAAPSDCGLAVGSAWLLAPPLPPLPSLRGDGSSRPLRLQYAGPKLFDVRVSDDEDEDEDEDTNNKNTARGKEQEQGKKQQQKKQQQQPPLPSLSEKALQLGARRLDFTTALTNGADADSDGDSTRWSVSSPGLVELAALLADDQVIGVVRGRAEFGPRALGHRSLLAAPSLGMKERMNALKAREWYRPVAPVLLAEEADRAFDRDSPHRPLHSPFMSFAPKLSRAAAEALPATTHHDNTARPQTVDEGDEPWLHALLQAVKARTGWGVLINTSFNTKGKPILNTLGEALDLLRDCEDLDYVLVEDWLFAKSSVV
jgi:predicted NodU family carbamoyl transferase